MQPRRDVNCDTFVLALLRHAGWQMKRWLGERWLSAFRVSHNVRQRMVFFCYVLQFQDNAAEQWNKCPCAKDFFIQMSPWHLLLMCGGISYLKGLFIDSVLFSLYLSSLFPGLGHGVHPWRKQGYESLSCHPQHADQFWLNISIIFLDQWASFFEKSRAPTSSEDKLCFNVMNAYGSGGGVRSWDVIVCITNTPKSVIRYLTNTFFSSI